MILLLLGFITVTFARDQTKCKFIDDLFASKTIASKNYDVNQVFDCIETFSFTQQTKKTIMNWMNKIMEGYAFKDILKNPPQPYENEMYYEKFDIDAYLKEVNTTTQLLFYDFYNKLFQMIVKMRDLHFDFKLNTNAEGDMKLLTHMNYVTPFLFDVRGKDFYLIPHPLTDHFDDQQKTNVNNFKTRKVLTINGEHPAEFIRKFGKQFISLKCPHAQFTRSKRISTNGILSNFPLPREYLNKKINVTYEGVQGTARYSYNIFIKNPNKSSKASQLKLQQILNGNQNEIWTVDDIIETEEIYQRKQALKRATPSPRLHDGEIVYCFVDDKLKVDTFVLTSFQPANTTKETLFINTVKNRDR